MMKKTNEYNIFLNCFMKYKVYQTQKVNCLQTKEPIKKVELEATSVGYEIIFL